MATEITNMRDLGIANNWNADSIEQRLVDMTREAGYSFVEEMESEHVYRYTCKEAGLTYRTISL